MLVAELERGAVAHGFENERWTLARVNEVIERLFGVCIADDSRVWRLLKTDRMERASRGETLGRARPGGDRRVPGSDLVLDP